METARQEEVKAQVAYLLERLRPEQSRIEKIILFGSAARDDVSCPDDLDVAILTPSREKFLTRMRRFREKVRPYFALDLWVYTPEEFARMLKRGSVFAEQIQKHGKVIYAKKPKRRT